MSIIVLKRRFEAAPSKDDILSLLVGDAVGNKDNAKTALEGILAPMKDLLALYQFVDNLGTASENFANLLEEFRVVDESLVKLKEEVSTSKANFTKVTATQKAKLGELSDKIAELEKAKTSLEDAQAARDRMNTAMVAEVEAAKKEMLAGVAQDVAKAKDKLVAINTSVEAAEAELAAIVEKKRQFIASLG
jgi:chromosome segregation ATPase